jgi:hypothetical protein
MRCRRGDGDAVSPSFPDVSTRMMLSFPAPAEKSSTSRRLGLASLPLEDRIGRFADDDEPIRPYGGLAPTPQTR